MSGGFNPRPSSKTGEPYKAIKANEQQDQFQSTPVFEDGRTLIAVDAHRSIQLFQSTPVFEDGRTVGAALIRRHDVRVSIHARLRRRANHRQITP